MTEAPPSSLYDTAAALLRHVRILVVVPIVTVALSVGFTQINREYEATSRISPQNRESGVAALVTAMQQGTNGAAVAKLNESVEFYADLARSREILDSVALTTFRFAADAKGRDTLTGTYLDLNHIEGGTLQDRLERGRRRLERKIIAGPKRVSGVITIQARAPWAQLAEQLNRRVLDLVNQFNQSRRRVAARLDRDVQTRRIGDLRREMEEAQSLLQAFQDRHRSWQTDPALATEMRSRQRRLEDLQRNYELSAERLEQAGEEEVRTAPMLTEVEAPEGSAQRTGGLLQNAVAGLFAGLLLAAGLILTAEYAAAERSRNPEAYERFRQLLPGNAPKR